MGEAKNRKKGLQYLYKRISNKKHEKMQAHAQKTAEEPESAHPGANPPPTAAVYVR